MISLEINTDELRKNKNFEEVAEITEQYLDEVQKFEDITQGELIRIMAEKLEEAGYPVKEIREKIDERMHGKVSRQYISQQLDDRFKNPRMVAAGKAVREREKASRINASGVTGERLKQAAHAFGMDIPTGLSSSTVMVEPESGDDTESDVNDSDYLERKNSDGYTGKPAVVKIQKMDDTMLNKLYGATTASAEHTYLLVNPQTGRVEDIQSDIEYERQRQQYGYQQ